MREIRQSGSEGGARFNPSFLPLSLFGSCLRRDRSQGQSVWSECLQLGWILRHGVGTTTVFWSARGRAQRRRRFGRARRGKSLWHTGRQTHSLPIRIPIPSTAINDESSTRTSPHLKRMAVRFARPKSGRGLPQSKTLRVVVVPAMTNSHTESQRDESLQRVATLSFGRRRDSRVS